MRATIFFSNDLIGYDLETEEGDKFYLSGQDFEYACTEKIEVDFAEGTEVEVDIEGESVISISKPEEM